MGVYVNVVETYPVIMESGLLSENVINMTLLSVCVRARMHVLK